MPDDKPCFFSIIIPTYNRDKSLPVCLESLACQDYPRNRFEVIVVDDGSRSSLVKIFEVFCERINIRLLRQQNSGPAAARNFGASCARGEYLAFTDDDCMPARDWLKRLAVGLDNAPDAMIGGHTVNALTKNCYSTTSQLLIDYLYSYYNSKPNKAMFFTSNNLAICKDRFNAINGFDTSYPRAASEDREFCDRWLYSGHRMIYDPSAIVYHAHSLSLGEFYHQHFFYGRGAFCFHKIRSKRNSAKLRVEPPKFYLELLRYPFKSKLGIKSLTVSFLLILTQLAHTLGYFLEAFTQRSLTSAGSKVSLVI